MGSRMNWFIGELKKYAEFSGCARRSEDWYYTLFAVRIYCGLTIMDGLTGTFNRELDVGLLTGGSVLSWRANSVDCSGYKKAP
jgi:hypothetical protein